MTALASLPLLLPASLPESARWWHQAACHGMDADLFHPVARDRRAAEEALKVCARCPVRSQCLDDAVAHGDRYGVRGGLAEEDLDVTVRQRRQEAREGRVSTRGWPP
jgi:WhiB family redox-sensing transcriptional regulator